MSGCRSTEEFSPEALRGHLLGSTAPRYLSSALGLLGGGALMGTSGKCKLSKGSALVPMAWATAPANQERGEQPHHSGRAQGREETQDNSWILWGAAEAGSHFQPGCQTASFPPPGSWKKRNDTFKVLEENDYQPKSSLSRNTPQL